MEKGIAITGMGIISSIGTDVEANYKALCSGQNGISFPEILRTRHTHFPVGEIKISDKDLAKKLKLSKNHTFTRAALLGSIAGKEAILHSGITEAELKETGFISGNSVGGMDRTEAYFQEFAKNADLRRFIRAQHPGFTTSQIADYLKIQGFVTTISTACSSSANAIMLGARMIKAGKLKRVVVGGTDCLTKFTLNGFNSLMILSTENCKPFDEYRSGLNLGEGAAYLVLEADPYVAGKQVLGRIVGYGNANDAFHQTASSETGEGAYLAMKKALTSSGISSNTIDYINAHGTATRNNDLSESRAIQRVFDDRIPFFSSTKAFTGHTLAGAGAIEAVFSLLGLQNSQLFPNLNFSSKMKETGLQPVLELTSKNLEYVLSNSFGFGGNCTSLIFRKDEK